MKTMFLGGVIAAALFALPACGQAKPDLLKPATLNAAPPAAYGVRLETSKGQVLIRVNTAWSPQASKRFYNLVRSGFYNNTYFFRNLDFMVQFGVSSDPKISQAWSGNRIPDDKVATSNLRGTMTFASRGSPGTRTTQVFINKTDNARLDPLGFQPFAEVVQGMDVVDLLYAGYDENVDQIRLEDEGEPYLNRYFPRLDKVIRAEIVPTP